MYNAGLLTKPQLAAIQLSHRFPLLDSPQNKRTLRIRNEKTFGDVTFDRQLPRLFHYTVQRNGSKEFLHIGQAESLPAAVNSVKSALLSLAATQ